MFMDTPFITILKKLEPHGVGQFADIAPTVLSIYSLPDNAENYQKQETSQKITSFLTIMEKDGLITFDGNKFNGLGKGSNGHINWLTEIKIMAAITTTGLNFLSADTNQKVINQVNKSVVDTNAATTKNFSRQTIISLLTIFIALLTAYISYLTFLKTSTDAVQEKRLKTIEENIQKLQQEKTQLQSPKVFPSNVYKKKDST